MQIISRFLGNFQQAIHSLGPIPTMLIILVLVSCVIGIKFIKALESGLRLSIALAGVGAVITLLMRVYGPALNSFSKMTGIRLSIVDVGWAPLATITWGSPYTLFFLLIMVSINLLMLNLKWTKTLDVDFFDVWHISFTALLAMYFGASLFLTTLLIILIVILKIVNSDLMKPTFNDLLGNETSRMTSTHMNYLINPVLMLLNNIYDTLFGWLDKYDFNVTNLNEKIGFWGTNFAIGCYLGTFVGLLGHVKVESIFSLAFTGAVSLQLFSEIGSWFIKAIDPLAQKITDLINKHLKGRNLNIGLDWAFINGRSEIWTVANILAPIMIIEALVLPGNHILPLGGVIAMGVTPALLVVTRGRLIRMIVIGVVELPLFLWAGTLSAPFITSAAKLSHGMISASTKEGPVEQFLAYLIGKASNGSPMFSFYAITAILIYVAIFYWYAKQMKKRNKIYEKHKID